MARRTAKSQHMVNFSPGRTWDPISTLGPDASGACLVPIFLVPSPAPLRRLAGRQVATKALDTSGSPAGAGALFGLAVAPHGNGVYFVDYATNQLNLLH